MRAIVVTGLVLPESFLHSEFFLILSTLVGLNTVVYAVISLVHVIPKWFKMSWFRRGKSRAETRSIYPDSPG